MKANTCVAVLSGWLLAASVWAAPPEGRPGPPACVPAPHCTDTAQRLSFPANALSRGSPDAAFVTESRGVRWIGDDGIATLAIRRPLDYADGEVTLSLLYEVLDDSGGDLAFIVTPVSFNDGSGFETYGDELTDLAAATGPGILQQRSAVLQAGAAGYQWPPTGEWWYFELRRSGSFVGPLRLMSVALDY